MATKHRASAQQNASEAKRYRRFAKHLRRWQNGEPVRTYDTRWLAYLQEQLDSAHAEESRLLGTVAPSRALFMVPYEEFGTMSSQPTSLERAFELARSGQFPSLEDIRHQLDREGLNPRQVVGPVLQRQLKNLIYEAHPEESRGLRR